MLQIAAPGGGWIAGLGKRANSKVDSGLLHAIACAAIMVDFDYGVSPMARPLQLPDGTVVLSNRFGCGPFKDFQPFVRVVLPQGVEIEGVYEAAHGRQPPRVWLHAFALYDGQRSHTVGMRWAPTEQGAKALIASLARTIKA